MAAVDDPPLPLEALPPLTDQPWQPISPRYKTVLRTRLALIGLAFALAPWFPVVVLGEAARPWNYGVSLLVILVLGFLTFVWVPRKVRRTNYLLRQLDLHLRAGCWWYRTVSVAVNRIQHLEITQGPLERLCGLSVLAIYTAGGYQSDLKIPGLERELAHQIKASLTDRITEEEPDYGSEE